MRHRMDRVTRKVLIAVLGALIVVLGARGIDYFIPQGGILQNKANAIILESDQSVAQSQNITDSVVKIAVMQFSPMRSKANNLERIERYLAAIESYSVDLVVFPEMTTTYYIWYDHEGEGAEYCRQNAELIPQGDTTQLMASLAAKYGMYISWGMIEKLSDSDAIYNSQVLMGPDGEVVGVYRKIHLVPGMEQSFFTPGENIEIYDTPIGKIAIMICYDRRFPELARIYSLMGAEIILVASATADKFVDEHLPAVRAYENSVWLVFANQVGSQPGGLMHGASRICDPSGNTRIIADWETEKILLFTTERSRIEKDDSLLINRRPEVYAKFPVLY